MMPSYVNQYVIHKYTSDPETEKLKLATPILEFGTAKPSGVVPVREQCGVYKHQAGEKRLE